MAEYKTIKGFKTQSYATDPVAATAAWSSGTALNTPRNGSAGAGVSNSSSLCFGGTTGPTLQNQTELYDGSTCFGNQGSGIRKESHDWEWIFCFSAIRDFLISRILDLHLPRRGGDR